LACIDILLESGKINKDDIPMELWNDKGSLNLSVEYVSRLALAMKMREVRATTDTMSTIAGLFEIAPDATDNYDFDKIAVGIARRFGMPQEFIRRSDEVKQMRQARQQKQAQQEALVAAESASKSAANLSQPIHEGSALNMLKQEYGY
jgi:hypothetical protein